MTDDLRERDATPDDYDDFVVLFNQLGAGDPVPPRDRWTVEMMPSIRLFEGGGAVAAYVFAQVMGREGYVRHLVVGADHRGRGVGTAAMRATAARLRALGCDTWCLNVRPENEPAVRLYTRCAMRVRYASSSVRIAWTAFDGLPRSPNGAAARLIAPDEDAAIESDFKLHVGQIASVRARQGRVPLALWAGGGCVGVACFDPRFPGAAPFRVKGDAYLGDLIDAMRPHALSEPPHVSLLVEDDEALTARLLALGGETRLSLFHMAGPIVAP